MDARKKSRGGKYTGPVIVTILVTAFAAGFIALLLWAAGTDSPPGPVRLLLGVYILAGLAVIVGVLCCLRQRIQEIKGGEEDEASQY